METGGILCRYVTSHGVQHDIVSSVLGSLCRPIRSAGNKGDLLSTRRYGLVIAYGGVIESGRGEVALGVSGSLAGRVGRKWVGGTAGC